MLRKALVLAPALVLSLVGLSAASCGTATSSASAQTQSLCSPSSPKLTVKGSGIATGTPNILTVNITISVTDLTAQLALSENNTKTAAVIAAFTVGGVTKANIQTTNLSVQPNYKFTNGNQVLTGYSVNNTLSATITNLSSAGTVIDSVSAAAGNSGQINSVSYSIKDTLNLEDQARSVAVHQALSHAQAMAAAANEHLGPVCSLTDTTPVSQVVPTNNQAFAAVPAAGSAVPLEVGSEQVSAQVTIVYSLKVQS